jgi:hypothetical protein
MAGQTEKRQKDVKSIPRVTKRIGTLRYFIKHRGTTKKNVGKATPEQIKRWKADLAAEEKLRDDLRKKAAAEA